MLKIYNSLTKNKETFEPLDPNNVRLYVCGPTVYDRAHIGNARPVVIFDTLYKLLKAIYPKVTYIRNITDIDDKINKKIIGTGRSLQDITEENIGYYHEDMGYLNTVLPDMEPRATQHIPEMISMISTLIDNRHAYEAEGHVLFDVRSMDDYGKLSKRSLDDMLAGARVEVAPYKKYAGDFVLWKPSDDKTPGWDSPWGFGRPGWHLECSAMSTKYFGENFDIHGGGEDLVFPHHENEIAQSCCAHPGSDFVKYWMHNAHVIVNGEKMSKSLGNFITVKNLQDTYPGEVLRFVLQSGHYRQKLDICDSKFQEAWQCLNSLYTSLQSVECDLNEPVSFEDVKDTDFMNALCDDLNTALAIRQLIEMSKEINKTSDLETKKKLARQLKFLGSFLGLLHHSPQEWFRWTSNGSTDDLSEQEIENLIMLRSQAKQDKDYQKADQIRDDLQKQGIQLEDKGPETTWKRVNC